MPKIRYSHTLSKEEIREKLILFAPLYEEYFLNYEYLIYSENFVHQKYYIVKAEAENFKHLTGVVSKLKGSVFFNKCLDKSINVDDFETTSPSEPDKPQHIYSKLYVFTDIPNLFNCQSHFMEDFKKGAIQCQLATSDSTCTLGFFQGATVLRPKTLLKGDALKNKEWVSIDFILRGPRDDSTNGLFNELISGDASTIRKHLDSLADLMSQGLLDSLK